MLELRPYQEQVLEFAAGLDRFVYADAPGTGKTPTTARWLEIQSKHQAPSLVVCPDSVAEQWLQTIANWTNLRPVDLRGTPAKRQAARETLSKGSTGVLSYDLLRRDQDALVAQPWAAVAFDEAHRLKGRTNNTALAAKRLRTLSMAMLTGTPILNSADELWFMLHLANPKQYKSFWRWAKEHFFVEMTTHHGKLARPVPDIIGLRPGHDELIREEAAEVMISRDIDTLLPGLPPVTTHIEPVELGEHERKLYDSISKKGWGKHGGTRINTVNAVSKMTRLRQLSSDWGGLADPDGPAFNAGAKVERAIELLSGTTEQCLVLTAFKPSARLVAEAIPGAVLYTGDQSKKERQHAVETFKTGTAPVLVGTIAAIGEGVDGLQVAHRLIRLDRDFTPARNEQVIARVRRSGQQADHILVVDIVAENTIDQRVAEILASKQDILDAVLG